VLEGEERSFEQVHLQATTGDCGIDRIAQTLAPHPLLISVFGEEENAKLGPGGA
jgi:hypothetical protein